MEPVSRGDFLFFLPNFSPDDHLTLAPLPSQIGSPRAPFLQREFVPMPSENRSEVIGYQLFQHRRGLYAYVYACVRDEHTAEDIVQDVARVALESATKLRDPSRCKNWLFGIAKRQVLENVRKTKREQRLPPDVIEILADEANNLKSQASSDRHEFLAECIGELSDEHRHIITQRYDGSKKNAEELANAIGRTVQATYSLVKRIRLQLAGCIRRKIKEAETDL